MPNQKSLNITGKRVSHTKSKAQGSLALSFQTGCWALFYNHLRCTVHQVGFFCSHALSLLRLAAVSPGSTCSSSNPKHTSSPLFFSFFPFFYGTFFSTLCTTAVSNPGLPVGSKPAPSPAGHSPFPNCDLIRTSSLTLPKYLSSCTCMLLCFLPAALFLLVVQPSVSTCRPVVPQSVRRYSFTSLSLSLP